MHVMILTQYYYPYWNACSLRLYFFVKALRKRKIAVDVFVLSKNSYKKKYIIGKHGERIFYVNTVTNTTNYKLIKNIKLKNWDLLKYVPGSLMYFRLRTITYLLNLLSAIIHNTRKKYDYLIVSLPPNYLLYIGWIIYKIGYAERYLVDIRDNIIIPLFDLPFSKIRINIYSHILNNVDHIVVANDRLKVFLKKLIINDKNIHVIYNGVPSAAFKYSYLSITNKNHKDKTNTYKGVIIADLNYPYHGIDLLIEAIYVLKRQHFDKKIFITIIGDGKYKQLYHKLSERLHLSEYINFIGYVEHEKVYKIAYKHDFGIVGRKITLQAIYMLPVKVFEYLAVGLPLFAFGPKDSELERFINKYNVGTYICSDNPLDIAKGLKLFLDKINSFNRKRLIMLAKKYEREKLSEKLLSVVIK